MSADSSSSSSSLATALRPARDRGIAHHSRAEHGQWTGDFTFIQLADTQLGMLASFGAKAAPVLPLSASTEAEQWRLELDMVARAVQYINRTTQCNGE
jgi:hypothetical protein